MYAFLLAACLSVAAQAPAEPLPAPELHRVTIDGPRDCWVWGVRTPAGKIRPVEYEPAEAPPRPSYQTNGVIATALATDARTLRASDPQTLAEVQAAAKKPEPAKPKPTGPDASGDLIRTAAWAVLWDDLVLYFGSLLLVIAGLVVLLIAQRRRNP